MFVAVLLLSVALLTAAERVPRQPSADAAHVKRFYRTVAGVPPATRVPMQLALKYADADVAALKALVERVSDPADALYGRYLTRAELGQRLPIAAAARATVHAWLVDALNASDVAFTPNSEFVHALVPAGALERACDVRLRVFEHRASGRRVVRALDGVRLPPAVHRVVDFVFGVSDFFDFARDRKAASAAAAVRKSSNAPDIMPVRGNHQRVQIEMQMFNVDGSPATAMQPSSFVWLNVSSDAGDDFSTSFQWNSRNCQAASSGVICSTHVQATPWSRLSIGAQVFFNDGQGSIVEGDVGQYLTNASMAGWVTPEVAFDMYDVPKGLRTQGLATQAVVAFEEQYMSMSDLKAFHEMNGLDFDPSLVDIVGPNNQSMVGGEAQLDISWIMAMGRGARSSFLSFCGPAGPAKGPCGAYVLDWAKWVAEQEHPPHVTSISYGDTESGYFNKFGSYDYIHRMETELAKMAARGLTVVAGSGDAGATNVGEAGNDISPTDPTCNLAKRSFYPSESRYVVSLSATLLSTHTTPFCNIPTTNGAPNTNVLCDRVGEASVSVTYGGTYWTTGGGFATIFERPSFQETAVKQYFEQVEKHGYALPPKDQWNANGRAYADLSALGFNLNIVLNGKVGPIGGTSASGPLLAGLLTILNDQQLSKGKPTLGSPHKWLYQTIANVPGALNDITYGRNDDGDWKPRGSKFPTFCPNQGFPLTPGFDAVSGLGSPRLRVWLESLP